MSDREKQILKILRRNPLVQQNEIANILQISRSRVAAHIMDPMRKGLIEGKGYILTKQDYCVTMDAINVDIRGVTGIRYPQTVSHPDSVRYSTGDVRRNVAHSLALLSQNVHLIPAIDNDFCGETLLEETRRAGVNVSNCIRLHGHSTATYLAIASKQEETILTVDNTHILQQPTPQLLNTSRDLIRHTGMMLADCNLTPKALGWVFTTADEIPVLVNAASEFRTDKVKNWCSRIHTLKPTRNELEILWGQPIKDDSNRTRAANSLRQQGVERIFVYLKDESIFCSDRDEERFLLATPTHTTVDGLGADDGSMASLVYSFLEGYNFRGSTRLVVACTAVSRANSNLNNPTLSANNAPSLVSMV